MRGPKLISKGLLAAVAVLLALLLWLRLTRTERPAPETPVKAVAQEVKAEAPEAPELQTLPEVLSAALPAPVPVAAKVREYEPKPLTYTEDDLDCLACGIYKEAGGWACSLKCQLKVGDVMLNRVADDRFPDSIRAVLEAPGQYSDFSVTGVKWPARAAYPEEAAAVDRAYVAARLLLDDTLHSELYGQGYIWQAEFPQGVDVVVCDGLYFGR